MRTLARPARRVTCPDCSPAATLPRPTPRPAQKPVSAPAPPLPLDLALVVVIRGVGYQVTPLDAGPDHTRAWRLAKADGEVYDVCRARDGRTTTCTCAHYEFRLRGNSASPCKHGAALIRLGLIAPAGA
jgi:hypothetical protein